MKLKNYNIYFFFLILAGTSVVTFFLLKPFLVAFFIAAVMAHLFGFVYRYFLKITKERKGISSGLACLVVALVIILPMLLVLSLVVGEVQNILERFTMTDKSYPKNLNELINNVSQLPGVRLIDLKNLVQEDQLVNLIRSFSQNALVILQRTYESVVHFLFLSFIMFFSLFYLFIDGKRLVRKIMDLSPLNDKYEKMLLEKFNSIVRSIIKGTTLIAIIQGGMGAILFSFTGVSSPVLLGILMTISSVIPSVGSGLVWLPVGLIMILLGQITQGIIILLVGGILISTVDNFIRPKLLGNEAMIHPLLILFSTFGGIALFGVVGFIMGPIIISLFVVLWEIYSFEFRGQLEDFNNSKI